ncbi:metallophosphoesterase family protein [Actinokineospora inagensis]|uniref:metallophosphoesterase family protein n=1 Tax=Actinokineospora inagensis TaxID=103730 RepID=UPI00047BA359|nr:metallophosphoesterase [Actinokineospora inagensis]
MIRVAAVGDVHLGEGDRGTLRPALDQLADQADVLLLAGDLTRRGEPDEARVVVDEFAALPVPVVAVLGNHDYHSDQVEDITTLLSDNGIHVLEGDAITLRIGDHTVGVAGVKGFGGGFPGTRASNFGEREMKDFVRHSIVCADRLRSALSGLTSDVRIVLTHYSPTVDTVRGEPLEIYPFLGCYRFGDVIDECGAHLAIHGHAHFGSEEGATSGGVPVRNVAMPVIGRAFATYSVKI